MLKMINSGTSNGYERRIYYQTTTSTRGEDTQRKKSAPREYEDQEQEEKVFSSDEMETPFAGNHYPVRTPLANGPPPTFVTRISQPPSLFDKRPVAPMEYDRQMAYDQDGTERDSATPSLANQPLPPTPKNGKYRELENQWALRQTPYQVYTGDRSGTGYMTENPRDLTPKFVGILFLAAAIILFFTNCIPVLVGRWNILYQMEFTSTFYSSQFAYYILLVATGMSIWTVNPIQCALLGACVSTILAVRLPSVIIGLHGAVSLLGFHTGTFQNQFGTGLPVSNTLGGVGFGQVIDPNLERNDFVPPLEALIAVLSIEGVIDLVLLAAAIVCFCLYKNYRIPYSGLALVILASVAGFCDIYPKLHFIVETAFTVDPNDQGYYNGNNLGTNFGINNNFGVNNNFGSSSNLILGNNLQQGSLIGGLSYSGSRAQCQTVYNPFPDTIWQNSVGNVSPYIFTVFVVFLALAPAHKKYSESYGWLVRTVVFVSVGVMVIAQIAILVSRSYTMRRILDPLDPLYRQGPQPTYGDCISRLIAAMIACRVIVLLCCLSIGGLLIMHEIARNNKSNGYSVNGR